MISVEKSSARRKGRLLSLQIYSNVRTCSAKKRKPRCENSNVSPNSGLNGLCVRPRVDAHGVMEKMATQTRRSKGFVIFEACRHTATYSVGLSFEWLAKSNSAAPYSEDQHAENLQQAVVKRTWAH